MQPWTLAVTKTKITPDRILVCEVVERECFVDDTDPSQPFAHLDGPDPSPSSIGILIVVRKCRPAAIIRSAVLRTYPGTVIPALLMYPESIAKSDNDTDRTPGSLRLCPGFVRKAHAVSRPDSRCATRPQ